MDGHDASLVLFAVAAVGSGVAAVRHIRRARAAGGTGGRRLVAGNLLVLACLLSAGLLATECWLRFFHDSTDAFSLLATTNRWFERHVRRNGLGVRDDREYDLGPVRPGVRRVTFVGDSFTAGHGVRDIRDRFAGRIRAARPAWDVQLLAKGGVDTGAQVEAVRDRVPAQSGGRLEYDIVVLVYCLNDIADLIPEVCADSLRLERKSERGVLARNSYAFDALRFLWIVSTEPEVRGYFPSIGAAYTGEPWTAQRARLVEFRRAVEARGGKLAVVTFPFLHSLGRDYPFRDAHRVLGEHWRAQGVPHLDLLATFEGRDTSDLVVGAFDAHPNEKAHALAAEAILPFLDGVAGR